jgi:peptide/nickel transport system permease protein
VGGSPAQVVLGKNATAEAIAAFDARYGYDKPLFCGRWARVNALEDGASLAADGARLPLGYALPEGVYQLTLEDGAGGVGGILLVALQSIGGESARTQQLSLVSERCAARATFVVPGAWRACSISIAGESPHAVRLRKRTAHWFDSQLGHFLAGLARGDLGVSVEGGRSVWQVLRSGVGPSLSITVPILAGGTLLAILFGLVCALWRNGAADRVILLLSTLLMSVNYVVWVLFGQYFLAFRLRLFPIWGFENWTYILLPVLIGLVGGLGRDTRFFRAVILDEIYKPYVRTAWAKGLSGSRVMVRHVLRNALSPIVTYVSLSIPFLFTGSLLLESFYGIPGLGCVSLNAIHSSDMAVVRAVVIVGALLYQGVNLITDLCYAWLDPRVRLG